MDNPFGQTNIDNNTYLAFFTNKVDTSKQIITVGEDNTIPEDMNKHNMKTNYKIENNQHSDFEVELAICLCNY